MIENAERFSAPHAEGNEKIREKSSMFGRKP